MPELRDIPLTCKEGVYSIIDFSKDIDGGDAISFDYDAQYQMLTYDIPVGIDYHAVIGTAAEMEEVMQKGCYEDSGDYSGKLPG